MVDPDGTPLTLAIVDDDPFIRAALGRLISSYGYDALLFDGAEALLADRSGRDPVCVLADLQMPGMGGVELIRRLAERSPTLPVIAMTAYPNDAIRRRALESGAAAYLTKPFDASQLETCLLTLGLRPNS
ncbi:MAG: response regulator [Methylobacterium mesophilicum]|nr:response regulator [Methylobacterium mesophilicum]